MPVETTVLAIMGTIAVAVIGVVVPFAQVITTFLSNKTIVALTQTVAEQAAVIKGLLEDRDHMPERIGQEIANNALLTAYAIELRKALTAADVPPSDQPAQPTLQALTQLTPGATEAVEASQEESATPLADPLPAETSFGRAPAETPTEVKPTE